MAIPRFLRLLQAATITYVLAGGSNARAATVYWTAESGDWSEGYNWMDCSTGQVHEPTSSDFAWVENGGTVRITRMEEACAGLFVGRAPFTFGRVEMTAGSLVAPIEVVGGGHGEFIQSGGTNYADVLILAEQPSGQYPVGSASYDLHGGTLVATQEFVGKGGMATFRQSGGTNMVTGSLIVAGHVAGHSSYTISGGRLIAPSAALTIHEDGEFTLNGGEVIANIVSLLPGGTFSANGSGTLLVNKLIGFGGKDVRLDLFLLMFGHPGGVGEGAFTWNEDFTFQCPNLVVAWERPARFDHSAGRVIVETLWLGEGAGSSGTFELSGDASLVASEDVTIGDAGTGTLRQIGGAAQIEGNLDLGQRPGSGGRYIIEDGRAEVCGNVHVGVEGTGTVDQVGGEVLVLGDLQVGAGAGSKGTFRISGGRFEVHGDIQVGGSGQGEFHLDGGYVLGNRFTLAPGGVFTSEFNENGFATLHVNGLTGFEALRIEGDLAIGHYAGDGSGYCSLSEGQDLFVAARLRLSPYGAPARFVQSGGTCNVGNLWLGEEQPYLAVYELQGGSLTPIATRIGIRGRGQLLQTGGTHVCDDLVLGVSAGSNGQYELGGTGSLTAYNWEIVGQRGPGAFLQTSGENSTRLLSLGEYPEGTGRYDLSVGVLRMRTFSSGDPPPAIVVGSQGAGVFNFGDVDGTGKIDEVGSAWPGDIAVRSTSGPQAAGTLRGWGTVSLTGYLRNNGRVIADGYGTDRTLDLSSFAHVTNNDSYGVVQGDGTTAGWYAVDRGALKLPLVAVADGSGTYKWGEDPADTTLDLVNSLKLNLGGVESGGPLSVRLLAPDFAGGAGPPGVSLIGAWDFETPAGFSLQSGALLIRYDDGRAQTLGLPEAALRLYQLRDGGWVDVTTTVAPVVHMIFADGITSLSRFAVGMAVDKVVSTASGQWHERATWDEPGTVPDRSLGAVVGSHTVAVDADAETFSLSIEGQTGRVIIRPETTLTVVEQVRLPAGTLDVQGRLRADSLEVTGGTLGVAPRASVEVGTIRFDAGSQYLCQLDASGSGAISADLAVIDPGTTLSLQALGNLGDLSRRQWGDKTRTVLTAQRGISGGFSGEPAPGEHLGYGVFFRDATYGGQAVDVNLFQAAPGDTDGDWHVDAGDVSKMLPLYGQGQRPDAGWETGDFDANGRVDFNDAWDMLVLYDQGDYSEWSPQEPAASEVTVYFDLGTGNISISTGSLEDLRGIRIESTSGIFTGDEPLWPENSLFSEFTPWLVGTAALPPLSAGYLGPMDLGRIARPGLDSDFLLGDLTILYTTGSAVNVAGRLEVVPEPASVVLLAVAFAVAYVLGRRLTGPSSSARRGGSACG